MRYLHRLRVGCIGLAALGLGSLLWLPAGDPDKERLAMAELRVAPCPLPPGATVVLVGRAGGVPPALEARAASPDLAVEAAERLSRDAMRVRLAAGSATDGAILRLSLTGETLDVPVASSGARDPLAVAANIPPEALRKRELEVRRPVFTYAFVPADGVDLASVCIFNETTAAWHQRDLEPVRGARITGDVRPDFLGVRLAPGANKLLIAAFTRSGISQLEQLVVTYVPRDDGGL